MPVRFFLAHAVLEYDFEQSVGYWLTCAAHALRRALDVELAREGITFRQWEVLAWLAFSGEMSQSDLADNLNIEAPTLAGILSRMERDGWLERYSCPDDRRCKRIRVTNRAEAVWNRVVDCCLRVRKRATQGIPEADLHVLKRVCSQIRTNLDSDSCHGELLAESPPADASSGLA